MSFDLRKFLTENKLTRVSRTLLKENQHPESIDTEGGLQGLFIGEVNGVPIYGVEDSSVRDTMVYVVGGEIVAIDVDGEVVPGVEIHTEYGLPEEIAEFLAHDIADELGQKYTSYPYGDVDGNGEALEETLDDQPADRDATDGDAVGSSFDPSKYESVEQLMREIEVNANRAALQEKMKRVTEAYESLEQKASALEEGEDSKYISSAKLQEMKRNSKTLRKMYEKYEKDYNKRFNEEMKPKKKKMNEQSSKPLRVLRFGYDLDNIKKVQDYLIQNYNGTVEGDSIDLGFDVDMHRGTDYTMWVGMGDDHMNAVEVYNPAILQDPQFLALLSACAGHRKRPTVAEQIKSKKR